MKNKYKYANLKLLGINLFKKSILTEKSVSLEGSKNILSFFTDKTYTKSDVRAGFEGLFGERPEGVRIINTKSKQKTFQGRIFFSKKSKKVMVRMKSLKKVKEVLNV